MPPTSHPELVNLLVELYRASVSYYKQNLKGFCVKPQILPPQTFGVVHQPTEPELNPLLKKYRAVIVLCIMKFNFDVYQSVMVSAHLS